MKLPFIPLFFTLIFPSIIWAKRMPSFSPQIKKQIGMMLWKNEANQQCDLLAFWNPKEPFPSFGIAHAIWYPQGYRASFTETFPLLLDFLIKKNIILPDWLKETRYLGAPWKDKESFDKDIKRKGFLKKLLYETIDLQTDFVIKQFHTKWKRIKKNIPFKEKNDLEKKYRLLSATPEGIFALIDYCNFKGDGLNPKERYCGQGWGLYQVLNQMDTPCTSQEALVSFIQAAKQILQKRIENCPPNLPSEKHWLKGWQNRIEKYKTLS